MIQKLVWLWCAGGCGTVLRFLLSATLQQTFGPAFPYGTLGVNLLGCFVIGVFSQWFATVEPHPDLRLILMAGLVGGFTTFSAFELETFSLGQGGVMGIAALYVVTSVVLGILAVWAGTVVMKLA